MTTAIYIAEAVAAICALLLSWGVFVFLTSAAHEHAARGEHLLAIIRWRDEAGEVDE